jgi:Kef-type K+ transport system membrane component KefB
MPRRRGAGMDSSALLFSLVVVWLAARLGGEAMLRLGQTAVVGELLAGLAIGPGALAIVAPSVFLDGLAEIGVVILLFEIGLASDLDRLLRSGLQSLVVALVGIVSPLLLGFALARWWGLTPLGAVFIGAALTATSVGVTARVFSELGKVNDPPAQVVLGAAVADDVLGLVILSVVAGLARTGHVSLWSMVTLLLGAVLFLTAAITIGVRLAPFFVRWADRMQTRGSLIVWAVLFCTVLAVLAERSGLAAMIGAFAAGLVLAKTERGVHIEDRIKPVSDLFVPIFFVTIGMHVDLRHLDPLSPRGTLVFAVLLTLVAVASKLVAALGVYRPDVRRLPVGVGMIPRGEVGLIFAAIGLTGDVITPELYAAVVLMIVLTTVVGPVWLRRLY